MPDKATVKTQSNGGTAGGPGQGPGLTREELERGAALEVQPYVLPNGRTVYMRALPVADILALQELDDETDDGMRQIAVALSYVLSDEHGARLVEPSEADALLRWFGQRALLELFKAATGAIGLSEEAQESIAGN